MTTEHETRALSGWVMVPFTIAFYAAAVALIMAGVTAGWDVAWIIGLVFLGGFCTRGFFTLQPNEARVLILFGNYRGTTRAVGFFWANPFYANAPTGQGGSSRGVEGRVARKASGVCRATRSRCGRGH